MGLLTTAEQNLLIDLLIDLDGLSDTNARLTLIRGLPQQRKREVDLNGRVRIAYCRSVRYQSRLLCSRHRMRHHRSIIILWFQPLPLRGR